MSNKDNDNIIYLSEDLPEINYFEIVSIDEIIKNNPNFIAFSREEIYNELFNFVKTKSKTECFLKLFYEIVNKKTNVDNFIVIADANRGNFEDLNIEEFISDLKKYDKINDANLALASKNKLWFPLNYDADNNKIRFKAQQKTIIELSEDNNYIVFKDDETNIPIIGVYFYSPITILDDYLNDKIMSHLYKPIKLDIKNATVENENFEDLIKSYKIKIPIDKIDNENYNYSSINNLLQKYNYSLDNISQDDFKIIKNHLTELNKKETIHKITYNSIQIKSIELINPRFTFFNILKELKILIDITIKSTDIITKQLKTFEKERSVVKKLDITRDLYSIITNLNDKNYDQVINNLRDLRKNLILDGAISKLELFNKLNKKNIINQLDELEIRFELLKYSFVDIYKLNFSCTDDEHEIHIGTDEANYEGVPLKIGQSNEKEDNYEYDDEKDEIDLDETQFNKYYNNQFYNIEIGFAELLKMILPFLYRMQKLSALPINYDMIVSYLFNNYRTIEPKITIIYKYFPDIEEDELNIYLKKPIKYILINAKDKMINAMNEYFNNFKNIIYDIIALWSITIQKDIIHETLFFNQEKLFPECEHLWDEYGAPYDIESKKGVMIYLSCIFREVYGDLYKDEYANLVPLDDDFKKIIMTIITEKYEKELLTMTKIKAKKVKINIGRQYYDTLYDLLKRKEYKGDNFLAAYIDALIYMPAIKFVKIHKYLQGCCLERIDENFTADLYFKTDRQDLKKAKEKLTGKRVFNMPRYKRFFIQKKKEINKTEQFIEIHNPIKYNIIDYDIQKWLSDLKDLKKPTIFSDDLISKLLLSVFKTTENYKEQYINYFNNKELKQLFHNYTFDNYKQISSIISKILYKYLKKDALSFLTIINNTINELDKLNSIITEDNINDINSIKRIAIIRLMALPSSIDNIVNKKFIPSIDIDNEVYQELFKEIVISIINNIKNCHMLDLNEQIDFINQIREKNKFDILARMNKKTREDKDIEKELKKYGLKYNEELLDNEIEPEINIEKPDNQNENDGEDEYKVDMEDGDSDDEYMQGSNNGFIYAD
uniref:Uncharacterized protein n=1 Tax=viral metagenome TaxID=1070528 RepID=A0A6C0EQR4_9ZZZZ